MDVDGRSSDIWAGTWTWTGSIDYNATNNSRFLNGVRFQSSAWHAYPSSLVPTSIEESNVKLRLYRHQTASGNAVSQLLQINSPPFSPAFIDANDILHCTNLVLRTQTATLQLELKTTWSV